MNEILFILAGGTGLLVWSIEKDQMVYDEKIESILKRKHPFPLLFSSPIVGKFKTVCLKHSDEMMMEDRENILDAIILSKCKKIVVIHGTKTAKITAEFLAQKLPHDSENVVVITGAKIPHIVKESDFNDNLDKATFQVITSSTKPGVYTHNLTSFSFEKCEGF